MLKGNHAVGHVPRSLRPRQSDAARERYGMYPGSERERRRRPRGPASWPFALAVMGELLRRATITARRRAEDEGLATGLSRSLGLARGAADGIWAFERYTL